MGPNGYYIFSSERYRQFAVSNCTLHITPITFLQFTGSQ